MTKKHKKNAKLRILESEIPLNPNRVIRHQEIKHLVDSYLEEDRNYKYRLQFLTMATGGLRSREVTSLRIDNFSKDFRTLRYRIDKPTKQTDKKHNVLRIVHKIRDVQLPEFLAREILHYCRKNYLTFKKGRLFNNDASNLRAELGNKRRELGGRFLSIYRTKTNGRVKREFRISCHSFRRFYLTYQHYINSLLYNPALALTITAREIGHTDVDTTMIYTHKPEDIGITDLGVVRTFDQLFFQLPAGQKTLDEFI